MRFILGLVTGLILGVAVVRISSRDAGIVGSAQTQVTGRGSGSLGDVGQQVLADPRAVNGETARSTTPESPVPREALSRLEPTDHSSEFGAFGKRMVGRLPSAKRCLMDPEFNPRRVQIQDSGLLQALDALIASHNERLRQLQTEMERAVGDVLSAKMEAGIDPPATWRNVPKEDVALRNNRLSLGGDGVANRTGTILRHGECPEFDQLRSQVDETMSGAKLAIVSWIDEHSR